MGEIDPAELLWAWLREGWKYRVRQGNRRMVKRAPEYKAQVDLEMALIISKGFVSYFLMVSDLVRFAKDAGIAVGPGRGSSAASLVCYLLRITEPDPLQFPLTDFSRFVDPSRQDLPDIDVDFDDTRRHEVRSYAVRKYGEEHVANIGTFTKYKGRNSIDDVSRVFGIPKSFAEIVKGLVVERSGGDSRADASLVDTFDMFPAAASVLALYPDLRHAIALEGNYRGMSVHAAGLVITTRPIADICALYTREAKGAALAAGETRLTSVSVDKYSAEYLNMMKMDLLGLSTMGMIARALDFAGMALEDLYRLPYDDPKTIAAFRANDVIGVFQFEGRATRLVGRDVRPDNFLELVDINALSRPGPLFSGTTAEYTDVKRGRREATRIHPIIDEITEGTKGQIIYQEQILHALSRFGGLSVKRVHEIRRIISQKLGEAQFNTSAEDFAANAVSLHGVTRELAMEVWGRVVTSASYAFVYSHSLSYTIIGYWCMWMKVHHPAAFYAAQLSKIDKEKWPRLIRDAEKHDIAILGVDPARSGLDWEPTGRREVRAGWLQVNRIGDALAARIIDYREGLTRVGRTMGFEDLINVSGIGPVLMKQISETDPEDPFGIGLTARALEKVRAALACGEIPLSKPTHTSDQILAAPTKTRVVWVGFAKRKEYKDVFEDERARTGDSLETIRKRLARPQLPTSCTVHGYDDGEEDVYLRFHRYRYPEHKKALQDLREDVDVILAIGSKSRQEGTASVYVDKLFVIRPMEEQ